MKAAILTSPNQWFLPHAEQLAKSLDDAQVFQRHEDIQETFLECLFILSYHRLVPTHVLRRNRFNLVVHASALPAGKGWAPLFWQVLEGTDEIPFTLFEATEGVDGGDIYMQSTLYLEGTELNPELRQKQADMIADMCIAFYSSPDAYLPAKPQIGTESFYPKRTPENSKLNVDRTIREQFNLLRTVDNELFPAYFELNGRNYKLKIEPLELKSE